MLYNVDSNLPKSIKRIKSATNIEQLVEMALSDRVAIFGIAFEFYQRLDFSPIYQSYRAGHSIGFIFATTIGLMAQVGYAQCLMNVVDYEFENATLENALTFKQRISDMILAMRAKSLP